MSANDDDPCPCDLCRDQDCCLRECAEHRDWKRRQRRRLLTIE